MFALISNGMENFADLVGKFLEIIGAMIPIVFGITFVVIAWGIFSRWILGAGNPEKIKEGNQIALIGVIALVIMSSIWAILTLLRSSIFG